MDEEKKVTSYEDFRETASDYGEDRGHDSSPTLPAVARARETAERRKGS